MIGKGKFIAAYALLCAAALYLGLHRDVAIPMKREFKDFPGSLQSWHMTSETTLSDSVQAVLKASDVLYRHYENGTGDQVDLYVGYHDGGKGSGEIHSPKHCLPGSGWHQLSSAPVQLAVGGGKLNLVRALYQRGDSRQLFLYWYQVREDSISDEYGLKLAEIMNSALHQRRDASFIRITVPVGADEEKAVTVGERFVNDVLPTLKQYLPT